MIELTWQRTSHGFMALLVYTYTLTQKVVSSCTVKNCFSECLLGAYHVLGLGHYLPTLNPDSGYFEQFSMSRRHRRMHVPNKLYLRPSIHLSESHDSHLCMGSLTMGFHR